ncbi:MAG: hypothetical protein WA913_17050, partial [Pricia sp.]
MDTIKNLVVFGSEKEIEAGKEYQLKSSNRDAAEKHDILLEENDKLLEFVLDDGTTWMCDASTLHEVYPELDPALERKRRDGDPEKFELPTTIDAPATERGIVGKVAVKILRVFFKKQLEKTIN